MFVLIKAYNKALQLTRSRAASVRDGDKREAAHQIVELLSWVCTACDKACIPIRSESRCLCGHRLKEHGNRSGTGACRSGLLRLRSGHADLNRDVAGSQKTHNHDLMPAVAGAAILSVPASFSFSFQLREAGYSSVGASTVIQTMILCHMPVAKLVACVRCFAVHGFATVGMHGVNMSR